MNELAQGKTDVNSWDEYMLRVEKNYQSDDILMNFITNMTRIHGTVVLLKEWVRQVKHC
ncbi:1,4-alpha-glucan branching enzyme [Nonlabens ulvanivorans]|nr:1,4-alpha-glucan branching enzyme [Nonlabens ulvanivorans]